MPARPIRLGHEAHRQQRRGVGRHLVAGAAAVRLEHRQHREAGAPVVVLEQPGDGQEVRHLPQEDDREQHPRLARQRVRRRRPADHRRQRARDRADDGRERRAQLERRVEDDVGEQRHERDDGRQHRRGQRQPQQAGERQRRREHQRLARRQPPVGDGPAPRPIHQRVDAPLDHLVERRRSAGDERRGERDVGQRHAGSRPARRPGSSRRPSWRRPAGSAAAW